MIPLRHAILDFISDLRTAGVRISVAESLDAMRAVAAAGIERPRMREALAAALIKEEADRATFDQTFARRFAGASPTFGNPHRSKGERAGLHGSSGGPSESAALHASRSRPDDEALPVSSPAKKPTPEDVESRPRLSSPPERRSDDHSSGEAADSNDAPGDAGESSAASIVAGANVDAEAPGIEAGRVAAVRKIERMPFANYSALEFETARDTLGALKRRFRLRVSRRLRIARAGRIDFRRTIRASLQHGGALGDLRFRARRPRHIDLLILADVSGSVKYASTLMLEIVAGATSCFHRVRSFVYIDRLAEASFEDGHLATTPAIDLFARSDFGRVLVELWDRRASLISRATVIVIMGDGRNNRRPARADLLRGLARLSRATLWLIPEPQVRWNTGDSAIRQYARECTAMLSCENLRELERGLMQVA